MRLLLSVLPLSFIARAAEIDVLSPIDSAYLCPRTPFQPLGSSLQHPLYKISSNASIADPESTQAPAGEDPEEDEEEDDDDEEETSYKGRLWEVRTSMGKGLGMFARRKIKHGTRILVEEPLFSVLPPKHSSGQGIDGRQLSVAVERAVRTLRPAQRGAFFSCFENRRVEDKEDSREVLIFKNNALPLNDGRYAMFPKIAKINHSCRPNAVGVYSDPSRSRIVWAGRDIEKGEEITVTYVPLLQKAEARQRQLEKYGFVCTCDVCENKGESDKRRHRMARLLAEVEGVVKNQETPKGNIISKAVVLVKLLEEEGLTDYLAKAYHLAAFAALRLEKPEAAKFWAEKELKIHEFADEDSQFSQSTIEFLRGLETIDD